MGRKPFKDSISDTFQRLFPHRLLSLRNHLNYRLAHLHYLLYPGLRHRFTGRLYRILASSLPVVRRQLLKGSKTAHFGGQAILKAFKTPNQSQNRSAQRGQSFNFNRGAETIHSKKAGAVGLQRKTHGRYLKQLDKNMQGLGSQSDGGGWGGFRKSVGEYVYGGGTGSPENHSGPTPVESRSGRRQRLADYVRAANEIRQSYYTPATGTRGGRWNDEAGQEQASSQELMEYVANGKEEIVLFPTYGRKRIKGQRVDNSLEGTQDPVGELDQGHKEEDVVADVDIRGWIYTPHTALPPSRKNRVVIAAMTRLCGIPSLSNISPGPAEASDNSSGGFSEHEAAQIQAIESSGAGGSYSALGAAASRLPGWIGSRISAQPPPGPSTQQQPTHSLSRSEIEDLHKAMQTRLAPFLTTPSFHMPLTVFLYNDRHAISTSLRTDNLGHFAIRQPVHFLPDHVRVLAGEALCAEEDIRYIDPQAGISLISDIDDTIKISGIGTGLREMFRNVFTRDMSTMPVPGVSEWFNSLAARPLGVQIHYLSNSPWQLYPFLRDLMIGHMKLPRGTWHLKKYSGFVQGIFEPVAERKKESLEGLMRDFPGRKWILVGDGGEGDLEVYTDVVKRWPGKVIAVYIRDVSGIGETVVGAAEDKGHISDERKENHATPPGQTDSLIDLTPPQSRSEDLLSQLHMESPGNSPAGLSHAGDGPVKSNSTRKQPPPRPAKPSQLRAESRNNLLNSNDEDSNLIDLEGPRRANTFNSDQDPTLALYDGREYGTPSPPRPPPRRVATSASMYSSTSRNPTNLGSNSTTASLNGDAGMQPKILDKKAELWKRRWEYADQVLAEQGILLRSWKVGQDVQQECLALTRAYMGL
ncbi:hypothetical protein DFH27DRAFT_554705 [Peziza echinospora]|nr:hypothetical protein DFH27DRAFT_554705 [Peziza echinospora]